jgi:hypothetical protein
MRHISTLSPEEGAGLWDAVMPDFALKPFRGSAYHFKANEKSPERVCFMSGVERLGVYFDGKVWADSDLQKIELDQDKVREYLASIGILLP